MNHFRLHGQQHVIDFRLINTGRLIFLLEASSLTESLNKDSLLEARVLLRQLLDKSLPYYALAQVIGYEREWSGGSRSEYAWAGHILFHQLPRAAGLTREDGVFWVSGLEKLSEEYLQHIASRCIENSPNFFAIPRGLSSEK